MVDHWKKGFETVAVLRPFSRPIAHIQYKDTDCAIVRGDFGLLYNISALIMKTSNMPEYIEYIYKTGPHTTTKKDWQSEIRFTR